MSMIQDGRRYMIMNVKSGTVLDMNYGSSANGARVSCYKMNTAGFRPSQRNQIWEVSLNHRDALGNWWVLKNEASGTALDLSGGRNHNGSIVQGWRASTVNTNQQWLFRKVPQSTIPCYQIISRTVIDTTRKVAALDLSGGATYNGAKVQIWEARADFSNQNQVWMLIQID